MAKAFATWLKNINDTRIVALSVQSLLASTSGDLQTARSLAESASQLASQDRHPALDLVRVALGHAMDASGQLDAGHLVPETGSAAANEPATHVGYTMPGLSRREWDVARLVARGQTNRQIAAQLYLSEKTIERHMSRIFTKLHITARASLATYVTQTVLATA